MKPRCVWLTSTLCRAREREMVSGLGSDTDREGSTRRDRPAVPGAGPGHQSSPSSAPARGLINSASSNLLAWAARDPDVVAIKQILSSISGPLVQRLVDAAESGKDVLVVLIGDHHDGQSATRGNSDLADAGVHVIRPLVASSSQQE